MNNKSVKNVLLGHVNFRNISSRALKKSASSQKKFNRMDIFIDHQLVIPKFSSQKRNSATTVLVELHFKQFSMCKLQDLKRQHLA